MLGNISNTIREQVRRSSLRLSSTLDFLDYPQAQHGFCQVLKDSQGITYGGIIFQPGNNVLPVRVKYSRERTILPVPALLPSRLNASGEREYYRIPAFTPGRAFDASRYAK